MSDRPLLSPNVLVGGDDPVGRAIAYLDRADGSEDNIADMIVIALNGATGRMERLTKRKLKARTYRSTTAISATSTIDTEGLTGAGFLALKTLDDALGVNLEAGSRIDAIAGDGSLTLTKKARASGAATVTFGSEPLKTNGDGKNVIWIPEYPVVEVYEVNHLDDVGVETALSLTNARLESTGRLQLADDFAPKGDQNILIECKAGYLPPSATVPGDWEEWNDLEQICLRLTQIMFQDFAQHVGRSGDISIVQFTQHVVGFELPADITQALEKYGRLW